MKFEAKNEKEMKSPSLKWNMILNVVKGLLGIVFPLITFPYASRVIGVEGLGKNGFASSIISYFSLIAAMGFSSYMRRTGSTVRSDKEKFNRLASEVFSLNVISTFFAYLLLFVVLFSSAKLRDYQNLIIILSFSLFLTTFGVDWVYSVFEDYAYITVRSLIFHVISLVLLFTLVKTPDDLVKYVWISVISSAGSNILNFFHSRKYCSIKLTWNINWKKHLPPVLVFWTTTLATTIYVSSDITILGFLCDDRAIGIYTVSVRVYSIVKSIVGSAIAVSIPRLCAYVGENKRQQYSDLAQDVHNTIITFTIPILIGTILYSHDLISFLGGSDYSEAFVSLILLSIALIFCMLAYFWGECVLVPNFREKGSLIATICSAAINITLNFILIPLYKQDAAAFTTIIGEGTAFLVCFFIGRKFFKIKGVFSTYSKVILGSTVIYPVSILSRVLTDSSFFRILIGVLLSVPAYFVLEIVLHNESVSQILIGIKKRLKDSKEKNDGYKTCDGNTR